MSMRAYRQIKRPVEADHATFNISDSYTLFEDIVGLPSSWENVEKGQGTFDVDVQELKQYVTSDEFSGNEDQRKSFLADIKDEEASGNNCITYICY